MQLFLSSQSHNIGSKFNLGRRAYMSSPGLKTMFFDRAFIGLKVARFLFHLALVFALVGASVMPTLAQTFRGKIVGTITDPQGAIVAGASVKAKNTATGLER